MVIDRFDGVYRFLSNFYLVDVMYERDVYPSAEHAYQAAKTFSTQWKISIRAAPTPTRAKRLGNQCPLRPDWDDEGIRLAIMRDILRAKFQHPVLSQKLLDTGDALLIEGNSWNDTFWGMCRGHGQNKLGLLLMEVRNQLRNDQLPRP